MHTRSIGKLEVSAIGLDAGWLGDAEGAQLDGGQVAALLQGAAGLGCTLFCTSERAHGRSERLAGAALAPLRSEVAIATRFYVQGVRGRAQLGQQIRAHLFSSLHRLGTDHLDLYLQHCPGAAVPAEDVAGVMGELIEAGLIRGWGQYQPTAGQVRRAHAMTPMTAVACGYSLLDRACERDLVPACARLGIGLLPVRPLASGRLARDLPGGPEGTGAQLALAWLLHAQPFAVPVVSARTAEEIAEDLAAASLALSSGQFETLATPA